MPHHRGGFVYPELSRFLFHPEVDPFKDIPRVPGETVDTKEINVFPPGKEDIPVPGMWGNGGTGRDIFAYVACMSPPSAASAHAAALLDTIRLTDEELDGILELQEEM
jgi:hypothetical protein